jgi:hypothetical protein
MTRTYLLTPATPATSNLIESSYLVNITSTGLIHAMGRRQRSKTSKAGAAAGSPYGHAYSQRITTAAPKRARAGISVPTAQATSCGPNAVQEADSGRDACGEQEQVFVPLDAVPDPVSATYIALDLSVYRGKFS